MSKLPFGVLPGHWGLRGKTREKAKAEYLYTGEELARKMIEIDHTDPIERRLAHLKVDLEYGKIGKETYDYAVVDAKYQDDPTELKKEKLKLDFYYRKIDEYERDVEIAKLDMKEVELERRLTELEYAHNRISEQQFDKKIATINGEPYIGIMKSEFRPELGVNGLYFEFDWNDEFISMLNREGFTGTSDETMVQSYFNAICKSVALEEEFLDTDGITLVGRRETTTHRRDDGTIAHS